VRPQAAAGELGQDLVEGLVHLGIELPGDRVRQLLDYIALLAKWNQVHNLTAVREPERMVTHHLLDSLATLPLLELVVGRAPIALLDVGSGGGLPGIPLAIARPEWRVTLCESSHKKSAFLIQAAAELELANVAVAVTRIEELVPPQPFEVAISRAFADLSAFVAVAARHLAPRGWLAAMKGVHPVEELDELPPDVVVRGTPEIVVPGLQAKRHLVLMQLKDGGE
jgi:16S rRNA (guanine527-N7)-methyltransferase